MHQFAYSDLLSGPRDNLYNSMTFLMWLLDLKTRSVSRNYRHRTATVMFTNLRPSPSFFIYFTTHSSSSSFSDPSSAVLLFKLFRFVLYLSSSLVLHYLYFSTRPSFSTVLLHSSSIYFLWAVPLRSPHWYLFTLILYFFLFLFFYSFSLLFNSSSFSTSIEPFFFVGYRFLSLLFLYT